MIQLKNNEKLYYIANEGCDDETQGLAIISDKDFPKFKEIIENLNKNSTYSCMPTLAVWRISADIVKEWAEDESDWDKLYLNSEVYMIKDHLRVCQEGEKVI